MQGFQTQAFPKPVIAGGWQEVSGGTLPLPRPCFCPGVLPGPPPPAPCCIPSCFSPVWHGAGRPRAPVPCPAPGSTGCAVHGFALGRGRGALCPSQQSLPGAGALAWGLKQRAEIRSEVVIFPAAPD